jgi:hypothetical protein
MRTRLGQDNNEYAAATAVKGINGRSETSTTQKGGGGVYCERESEWVFYFFVSTYLLYIIIIIIIINIYNVYVYDKYVYYSSMCVRVHAQSHVCGHLYYYMCVTGRTCGKKDIIKMSREKITVVERRKLRTVNCSPALTTCLHVHAGHLQRAYTRMCMCTCVCACVWELKHIYYL